jgi:8-oxo-dGTP pyrophosphatase MutT (NUDIX family)
MAEHDWFLTSTVPLRPANAPAALLVLEDGRYLMQLRDQKPDILYPGHWGLFGGATEPGENANAALKRELREELGVDGVSSRFFTRFDFDLTTVGTKKVWRMVFEVPLSSAVLPRLVLGEGAAVAAFAADDLLLKHRVVPYDAFAVWLHYHRARFGG